MMQMMHQYSLPGSEAYRKPLNSGQEGGRAFGSAVFCVFCNSAHCAKSPALSGGLRHGLAAAASAVQHSRVS